MTDLPPDKTANCPRCGKLILVQHWLPDGRVLSEYQSDNGECFRCSQLKRPAKAKTQKQGQLLCKLY